MAVGVSFMVFLPSRHATHRLCSRCCNKFVSRRTRLRLGCPCRAALQQFICNKGLVLLHSFNCEPKRWVLVSNHAAETSCSSFHIIIRTLLIGQSLRVHVPRVDTEYEWMNKWITPPPHRHHTRPTQSTQTTIRGFFDFGNIINNWSRRVSNVLLNS